MGLDVKILWNGFTVKFLGPCGEGGQQVGRGFTQNHFVLLATDFHQFGLHRIRAARLLLLSAVPAAAVPQFGACSNQPKFHYSFIFILIQTIWKFHPRSRDWPPASHVTDPKSSFQRGANHRRSFCMALTTPKAIKTGRSAKGEKATCVTPQPEIALTAHCDHLSTHFKSKPCAASPTISTNRQRCITQPF